MTQVTQPWTTALLTVLHGNCKGPHHQGLFKMLVTTMDLLMKVFPVASFIISFYENTL